MQADHDTQHRCGKITSHASSCIYSLSATVVKTLTPANLQNTDIGNVQEHTLSVFTLTVCQYWPSQSPAQSDRVLQAKVQVLLSFYADTVVPLTIQTLTKLWSHVV